MKPTKKTRQRQFLVSNFQILSANCILSDNVYFITLADIILSVIIRVNVVESPIEIKIKS